MVPYLSPIVLRKEVESLLSLDGPEALGRDELLNDKPIIYWNLVWYLSRLYLPTYLPLLKLRAFVKNRPDLKKVVIYNQRLNELKIAEILLLFDMHACTFRT